MTEDERQTWLKALGKTPKDSVLKLALADRLDELGEHLLADGWRWVVQEGRYPWHYNLDENYGGWIQWTGDNWRSYAAVPSEFFPREVPLDRESKYSYWTGYTDRPLSVCLWSLVEGYAKYREEHPTVSCGPGVPPLVASAAPAG